MLISRASSARVCSGVKAELSSRAGMPHVADVADDGRGDDRADPEQPGEAGPGRLDRCGELLLDRAPLGVDAAQVLGEVRGELAAGRRDRVPVA